MNILTKDDVYEGAILEIYNENRLEGYARLLSTIDPGETLLKGKYGGPVYRNQRWRIQWVDPSEIEWERDEVGDIVDKSMYFTQRSLSGLQTHKYIQYKIFRHWNEYWLAEGRNKTED